jgi:hypothetical protein
MASPVMALVHLSLALFQEHDPDAGALEGLDELLAR